MIKLTKQEQKDEAWKRFIAIRSSEEEAYYARIQEIDEQDESLQVDKEI